MLTLRTLFGSIVLIVLLGLVPRAPAVHAAGGPEQIKHVIVIYQENWSFDGLYGKFPGSNGIANAGAAATQVDKNSVPYGKLPSTLDLTKQPPVAHPCCPADLPNQPFDLSLYVPPDQLVGSPI